MHTDYQRYKLIKKKRYTKDEVGRMKKKYTTLQLTNRSLVQQNQHQTSRFQETLLDTKMDNPQRQRVNSIDKKKQSWQSKKIISKQVGHSLQDQEQDKGVPSPTTLI